MVVVEIIGEISNIEIIAAGRKIRELKRLRREYGAGRWRKLKGVATVRLMGMNTVRAEIHWYEAHGIGRHEIKVSKILS
jgi:hypothetical protein